jgi:DNA repair protein RadA/Sms
MLAAMAKASSQYVCQACGSVHPRWAGKCSGCGAWDTLVEEKQEAIPKGLSTATKAAAVALTALNADITIPERISTTFPELDRTLGGGLVAGAGILLGGDPGIGKSTLLLQVAANLACTGCTVLYLSGEESAAQIQLRAARLGVEKAPVHLANATSVRDILGVMKKLDAPALVIIDSIQTVYVDSIDSAPGTVAQVRASAAELVRLAKKRDITLILVGHVTKEGQIAGPRVLEHMVDCVLYFEGERSHLYRLIRSVKNRFGAAGEVGVFAMGERGLQEVGNPSSLFLSAREQAVSGAAIHVGMEGTRPVLLEMEALVSPSPYNNPRRAVVGWDSARLAMLLAVLEARAAMPLADREVYLNVAGGYKVNDPSADMAAAAALISARLDAAIPMDTVCVGEIGLSGEIRPVPHSSARLREAAKLGFKRVLLPRTEGVEAPEGLTLVTLSHIRALADWVERYGEKI